MSCFFVALGGGLGAILRLFMNQLVPFPFGTMFISVIGYFVMGITFVAIGAKAESKDVLFLITGILGGLTAISVFLLDVFKLWEAGKMGFAFGYIKSSVVLSLLVRRAGVIFFRVGDA